MPSPPNPALIQRLRRLGFVDDDERLPELDELVPPPVQATLLSADGVRSVIRIWADARATRRRLPATALVVLLDHLRERPAVCADYLRALVSMELDDVLAKCSLDAGRRLHESGRQHDARANVDISVNLMLEAQRELLFASTSGRLSRVEMAEALGKYAVAVCFSSRWIRTSASVLTRACELHTNSIAAGNTELEAYEYLVELRAELFNQTGDDTYLDSAIALADDCRLDLPLALLLLKRGVLRRECDGTGATADLQEASRLADSSRPRTGVEFVQRTLVWTMSLSSIVRPCPLSARAIRFPYGFLLELPGLADPPAADLRRIVLDALHPMREELRNRRPNLVCHQLLASVLRDALERCSWADPAMANELVEITDETARHATDPHLRWRHAEALLIRARCSGSHDHMAEAVGEADALIGSYPRWPLPWVTRARAVQLRLEHDVIASAAEAIDAWTLATSLVVECPEYRRTDLGGRSGVFAVEDARGDLSTALIFKPVASESAGRREAEHMELLRTSIEGEDATGRFGVPLSLAVVGKPDGEFVHVMERQLGRVLAAIPPKEAAAYLPACNDLLAMFHRACGSAPAQRSGWPALKNGLKLWSRALFEDEMSRLRFVEQFKQTLPTGLPLVRKRDAHAGNWVIDSADRVIAIDLEGTNLVPAGHDVAQMVEDAALLPVSDHAFSTRYQLLGAYMSASELAVPNVALDVVYDWFALYRAVWLATSASASKAQHAHAKLLADHIGRYCEEADIRQLADHTLQAIQKMGTTIHNAEPLTASHRRLSRAMARILRHRALEHGLVPDEAGSVAIDELSRVLAASAEEVVAVASHPAEPRFQVLDGSIRALYGHSFPVTDQHEINVELPKVLYHGTSWDSLREIAVQGLKPMGRQQVHLTNNPAEAIEVARRHGRAVLLAVETEEAGDLRAVADAVWAASRVEPPHVRIRNAFADISEPPGWLTELKEPPP